MATLMDKWLKVKKSGHFHRNWKTNKLMKYKLKNEFKGYTILSESNSNTISNINLASPSPQANLETLGGSLLRTCNERENWLNEMESSSDEEYLVGDNDTTLKINNKDYEFTTDLRFWANTFHIKHNALKVLMGIINKRFKILLPVDPRTFMQTPTKPLLFWKIGEGQYWHQGLKICLGKNFVIHKSS